MRTTKLAAGALALIGTLLLGGCTSGETADDNTLTLWHFESEESAMTKAWNEAIRTFERETGATVKVEVKSFEQIRSTASQILNSNEAPDVLEYNKGNATAGLLASQGLLANLDDAVRTYGWDKKLAPSLQTTARYDDKGVMGSGSWYGVPNYGEFVEFYYNKDLFAEHGIAVPGTVAELELAMQQFVDKGITPLAASAAEYPVAQLWYQLALSKADRDFVNSYQLYQGAVDWQGEPLNYASTTIADWTKRGFIAKEATGIKSEDAGVAFISGKHPLFFSGSWWFGRFQSEIDGFEWGTFRYPDSTLTLGSAGNMWAIPETSKHKALAEQFIDVTMRPEIQAILGNAGGVPVAADPSAISDPQSRALIEDFNAITANDGLAFYPDWPTPTFYDQLNSGMQDLLNGVVTPKELNTRLGKEYQEGVDQVVTP